MGVGLFMKKGKEPEPEPDREEIQVEVNQHMELFTTHPDFPRIRIKLKEFNYSCLGPNLGSNANENFQRLVARFIECGGDHFSYDPQLVEYATDPDKLPAFGADDYWTAYNFWQLQTRNTVPD